jgi:hypothetical protein
MKINRLIFGALLVMVGLAASLSGCKKEENPNILANQQLSIVMDDWYFWYDMMPEVDYENYPSPVELLEAYRYQTLDKWSYITTKQALASYYDEGQYVGFGFGSAFDTSNQLWITFVFENSPFKEHGVDRGWRIAAIDGTVPSPSNVNSLFGPATAGISRSFSMLNRQGETVSFTVQKRIVTMNTVLLDTVYTTTVGKVGYFVLKGFINPTVNELNTVFSNFITQGASELIVDLRYNGGGSVDVATHLAGLIAGQIADGEIFGIFEHNDKHTQDNGSIFITNKTLSLYLNRIIFITTDNSASASELLINGLKPHMPVTLVGGRTYGKPVGMYGFTSVAFDWAFVPICFRIINASNEGDYYDGIPVDIEQIDGINYPFGDLNEPSLNSAIAFIEGGTAKVTPVPLSEKLKYPVLKGLNAEIGAW